jgi:hypothetical protein
LFKIPFTCETPVHLLKYGGVFIILYRKEEWQINLIEIMNYAHIINTHFNSLFINFTTDILNKSINKLRIMKMEFKIFGDKQRKIFSK